MIQYIPPRYLFRRFEILKNIVTKGKFLEIGAGNLLLAQDILKNFEQGTIVDFSNSTTEIYNQLKNHAKKKLELRNGDFSSLNFQDDFNCILACEVLEHIQNDLAFLIKTFALLKRNGQIILSVPAKKKLWSKHDEITGHKRRYEKNELFGLLKKTGYKDIQIISYGYPFINILRLLRILFAGIDYQKKITWAAEEQTKKSGPDQIPPFLKKKAAGLITNKYVFYPFNIISTLFNRLDLSDGYIAVARKK